MSDSSFQGFRVPEQNWFKLPNEWTNITHDMTSLAELKVVEYVLRHTWGFSEYDKPKHITLDEFENGRKRKDGSRMDKGTGLSQPSITDGVKRAVEHGYLEVRQTGDNGRIRKLYRLRILGEPPEGASKETWEAPLRNLGGPPKKLGTDQGKNPGRQLSREKKDSLSGLESPDPSTNSEPSERPKKPVQPTAWDYKAADELNRVVSSAVKVNKRMDRKKWANVFRIMRTTDSIPKKDIREMIEWYAGHIGGQFDVQAYSAQSFRDKWEKLVAAKIRDAADNGIVINSDDPADREARIARNKLKRRVRDKIVEQQGRNAMFDFNDRDIQRALTALGEDPDLLTEKDWEE